MKKTLFLLLALCLLLVSCGESTPKTTAGETGETAETAQTGESLTVKVKNIMTEIPDYELQPGASVEEMRQMAVKAMRDELNVKWMPAKAFHYQKTGSVGGQTFQYILNRVYAGLPYSNGSGGLMQFLTYYNFETGVVDGLDFSDVNSVIGNTCAESVMWGWNAVCSTVKGQYVTWAMTVQNGVYPVAPITYDTSIQTFREIDTVDICKACGEDTFFEAYANTRPADGVVMYNKGETGAYEETAGHAMMIVSEPVVVRNGGKIDPDQSYVLIQDQRAGVLKTSNYVEDNGQKAHFSGRIEEKYTFRKLFDEHYMPVTPAEFLGQVPYVPSAANLSGEITNSEELLAATVKATHSICVIRLKVQTEGREETESVRLIKEKSIMDGSAENFPLSEFAAFMRRNFKKGKDNHITVSVLLSTGRSFTVLDTSISE